jgi:TP901 family phage tail tape measure protein
VSMTGFTSAITISVFGTSNLSAFNSATKRLDTFAGSFEQTAERVKKAGLKTMLVGAGIAASLAMPILQVGKFETQVARVGGIAEATAAEVVQIGDAAKYLGARSLFTAQQVAEGQGALASMGLTATQVSNQTGIMADTVAFATGQQVEMADAGALLVGTLNSYQKPLGEAAMLSDYFTAAMNKTNLAFTDLQESMVNTASTSATFGQSVETNLALLGVLANRNETGARAGTRLAMTMTKLYTQSGKLRKGLGVEVYDQATGKTRDFIEVFGEMKAKLGSLSEEKKNLLLTDIFGAEGIKVFNILLSSSREELMGLRTSISQSSGAAKEFQDRILGTPTGHWKLMKSAVDGVSMQIGSNLMPLVIPLLDAVKGVAEAILGWMEAHPALAKLAVGFMGVLSVGLILGGMLLFVGGGMLHLAGMAMRLPAKLGQVALSMGVTNSAAIPLTASLKALAQGALKVVTPFALVGAAIYGLVKAWDTNFLGFRDTVEEVWFAVKPVVFAIWGGIKAMGQGIATVFDATLGAFWRFLTGWYKGAMSGISPILFFAGMVAWGLGFMVGTILRAWNWIKANPIVSGLLFVSLAAFAWPLILSAAKAVWMFATQTVLAGGRAAGGFLVARGAALRTAAATLWAGRSSLILRTQIVAVAAATKAWSVIQWAFNAALSANPIGLIIGLVALLAAGFVLLYTKVEPVRTFLDGLWDGFKSGLNWVIEKVNGFIKTVNMIPGVEIPLIPTLDTGAAAKVLPTAPTATPAAVGTPGLVRKGEPSFALTGMGPAVSATSPLSSVLGEAPRSGKLSAVLEDAPRGGKLAAASQGGLAAAMSPELTPVRPSGVAQSARAITRNQQTTTVDRRIHVAKIEIQSAAGTPATSIKDQLLEALREAAGQEDGIDEVSYAQ